MKRLLLALAVLSTLVSGCARNYVITLTNGHQITSVSKPRLQGNVYTYTDNKGQPVEIFAGRVREVAPASMAGADTGYSPKSSY